MRQPFRLDPDNFYRSTLLEQIPWLEHGFGTKLSKDWLSGRQVTTGRQIHSDRILIANGRKGHLGEGDAIVTSEPRKMVEIRTADCVPILIADRERRVVAAVHAGWRGTVSSIAIKTVTVMAEEFGSGPDDLVAAIGPAIGECCYEVGAEVAEQFQPFFPEREDLRGRARINLAEANSRQLEQAGIRRADIHMAELCTSCHGDMFESYRRDRDASGRMAAAIGIQY